MKLVNIEGTECLTLSRSIVARATALAQCERLRADRANIATSPDAGELMTIMIASAVAGLENKYRDTLIEIEAGRALKTKEAGGFKPVVVPPLREDCYDEAARRAEAGALANDWDGRGSAA